MREHELEHLANAFVLAHNDNTALENRESRPSKRQSLAATVKYLFDTSAAAAALIFLAPLILALCGALLIAQGRPIFISHRRIGRNGVMFPCLKFRSMVTNGDEILKKHLAVHPQYRAEWEATRKLKMDPRVTSFGSVLRKTSLDEIPQLWNVLKGDMSLVGPRPIVASEAELYGVHFGHYIKVRPGLTGLWQVSGRSETSYTERVQLDVQYVEKQSFGGDVAIMLKTVPAVLRTRGSY